jgi:pyruvate,orthophosphate dikinase
MTISEATDMVLHSLPSLQIRSLQLDQSKLTRVGFGIGVSDGEVAGLVATNKESALWMQEQGEPYIFCAEITSPDDTEIMRHSVGVLTSMGGRLSHAAILARSMNKPTVVGFDKMTIKGNAVEFDGEYMVNVGGKIKIDGMTGAVYYAM